MQEEHVIVRLPQPALCKAMRRSSPSRYFRNGAPRTCACCGRGFPVRNGHHECRRGSDERYYCDQFCEALGTGAADAQRSHRMQ